MSIMVQKYGGTSVGTPERIKAVCERIIKTKEKGQKVVVIVSAMGKTTDHLVDLANQLTDGKPNFREYDALVSTGENVSAALLSMTLIAMGHKAVSLTGGQAGVLTEAVFSKAKIIKVKPKRINDELDQDKIVVITGFQGVTERNDVTTIGRGGSDASAVIIAAALSCKECEIYTDVDGVYTTDPRLVDKASKLENISHDEMLELASLGAKVLHPRSVEYAKEHGIIIHVRSSFVDEEGTKVKEVKGMEMSKPVTGVVLKEDEAKLSILMVPDKPGVAGRIFSRLTENNINVDMIIQSTEQDGFNNITFTVSRSDFQEAKKVLKDVADEIGAGGILSDDTIAKVSIVGVGMTSKPGIAAKMFNVLGEHGINIELISTSEIKVSCAISEKDGKEAVKLLHDAFELHKLD